LHRVARVFLSHVGPEAPAIRRLATALREVGHDIWIDDHEFVALRPAGAESRLYDADILVVFVSKAAPHGWLDRDTMRAMQFLAPRAWAAVARLEDVALPEHIASLPCVDLFPDDRALADGMAQLAQKTEAHRTRHADTSRSPAPQLVSGSSAPRLQSPLGSSSPGAESTAPPVPRRERGRVARVFLSHASPDKPTVRRIAAALRAAGHEPWLDEDDILVGESIPAAVERGLRDADFVVLCLSKAAAARGWVEAERDATLMQQFSERKERVLPARLEDVAPPYLIAQLAYVDLFPDEQAFERGVARLTRSIEAHQARHTAAAGPLPASTPPIGRSPPVAWPFPARLDADLAPQSERVEDVSRPRATSPDLGRGGGGGGSPNPPQVELGKVAADLVVITVLDEEYDAVVACLTEPRHIRGSARESNLHAWKIGKVWSPLYEAQFRVAVGQSTATTTEGALATTEALRLFAPRYIAFVGVAGGFPIDGQRHSDVAVSSVVWAYEYGKVDTGGFAPRQDFTYRCDAGLVRAVAAVRTAKWWHDDENPDRPPRVRTGPIASGDKVIDDPNERFFAAVRVAFPKLLAVEMEGAGVAAAIHAAQAKGQSAGFVLVRGISDMPHTKPPGERNSTAERDGWKQAASRNAARFLAHLVAAAWPTPPRGEAVEDASTTSAALGGTMQATQFAGPELSAAAHLAQLSEVLPGTPTTSMGAPQPPTPERSVAAVTVGAASTVVAFGAGSAATAAAQSLSLRREEETEALAKQLDDAFARRKQLQELGESVAEVAREILDIKRRLREGGQLRAGDRLGSDGRYQLIHQVGRGGFAVVWKAKDRRKEIHVAIKVLHANLSGDLQRRERFFRGARMMQMLDHPAVVRVLDPHCEDGGFRYFVMEFVPGSNLHDAVLTRLVTRNDVLPLILEIGEALAQAHAKGMIHRDIKPANILLDEQGNARLTDFDLVGAHDTTGGTRTGAMGTVVYAAPEGLQRPQDATPRADVFGLGMTAIFCLAGHDLTMDTLVDRTGALAELDCTESVRRVLTRAVEWKADRRFADAAAMVAALRDAMDGSSQSVTSDGRGAVTTQPVVQAHPVSVSISSPPEQRPTNDAEFVLDVQERPAWAIDSGRDNYGLWAAFEVEGVRQRMRWIPPGTFLMGSPSSEAGHRDREGPQHEVTLTRGYWLGETPVTQALWVAVIGDNPSRFVGDDRPVERVSWSDCQEFIARVNRVVEGLETRLPTEAEWEYACRAGTTAATWVGDLSLRGDNDAPELDAIAWYGGNSGVDFEFKDGADSSGWPEKQHPHTSAGTHPVGRKAPNPFGLYDMLGNVWEWCAHGKRVYLDDPVTDPVRGREDSFRIDRGGAWSSSARWVRAAYRGVIPRESRDDGLGFRLAAGQASARSQSEREPPERELVDHEPGREPPRREPPEQELAGRESPERAPLEREPPKREPQPPPERELADREPGREPPRLEPPEQELADREPGREPPRPEPPEQELADREPGREPPRPEPPEQELAGRESPEREPLEREPPKREPQPRARKFRFFFIGSIVAVMFARNTGVEKPPSDAAGPPDVLAVMPPDAQVTTFPQDAVQVEIDATIGDAAVPDVAVPDAASRAAIPAAVTIKPASVFVLTEEALLGKWTFSGPDAYYTDDDISYAINIQIQKIYSTDKNNQCCGIYTEDTTCGRPSKQCGHCESPFLECRLEETRSDNGPAITELTIDAEISQSPCHHNGFSLTLQQKSLTKAILRLSNGDGLKGAWDATKK
jgi:formylglycine-generating enzyme required for sulfatase activity/nucleoside phosphorylase